MKEKKNTQQITQKKKKTNLKVVTIKGMKHYCPPHLLYTGQSPYWTVTSSIAISPSSLLPSIII